MVKAKPKKTKAYKQSPRAEDTSVRKKYKKGGRVEAYTFGEALSSKRWP